MQNDLRPVDIFAHGPIGLDGLNDCVELIASHAVEPILINVQDCRSSLYRNVLACE